jgi:hypothetical protein
MEKKMSETLIDVGEVLYKKVQEQIDKLEKDFVTNNIRNKLTCMIAEFQADSVIAYRTIHKQNDIVITADLDQSIHTGTECLCIKAYQMKEKDNQTILDQISLFSGCKKKCEYISDVLNLPTSSPNFKNPKYPIMDLHDVRTRSLVAIGIGCDVIIDGVPGMTPKKIHDEIIKWEKTQTSTCLFTHLMDAYLEHVKKLLKKKKKTVQEQNNELVSFKK